MLHQPKFAIGFVVALVETAAAFASSGCQSESSDARPERVVQVFIERMNAVHGDPERGRAAVALLSKKTRQNLEARAERASAAAGRQMSPEEMLAPSRFSLRMTPKTLTADIHGDYATVLIQGETEAERSEAHCVKEDGRWRVSLDLPELPMLQKRDN